MQISDVLAELNIAREESYGMSVTAATSALAKKANCAVENIIFTGNASKIFNVTSVELQL